MNLFGDWSDFPIYFFMWYITGIITGYLLWKIINENNLKK